jgi:hypothetical protein
MRTLKLGFRPLFAALAIASVVAAAPSSLEAQKVCRKGKPCGNTCIAVTRTCHVGTGSARQAAPGPTGRRTVEVPDGMQYVASTRGRTYYHVGCSGWRSLSAANLRWFKTREDAVAAGLRPSSQKGCPGPTPAADNRLRLRAARYRRGSHRRERRQ